MTHKLKIVLFTLLMFAANLWAQERWTLEECVAYALDHNLQLNDFEYTEQSNRESYRQSIRNLLPSVNGYADYQIRFGRQINPNDNSIVNTDIFSNNYSLGASFDLFQGFQKINGIKAAKFLRQATREETLQQKYLLAFRVMTAYYNIRFMEDLIEIAREQVGISEENFNLVKRQIELGIKARADLYEAEALLMTDQLALTQNENQLQAAKLLLLQEMNLENQSDINVQPEFEQNGNNMVEVATDSIFDNAISFMPLIRAQEYRVRAAKKDLAVARGGLSPSLTLQGGYGTGFYETITDTLGVTIPFRTQINNNMSQYIGVALNIPISNGWSLRSRVKQRKIALDRAENNAKIQEQELFKTIQQLAQENKALHTETVQTEKKMNAQEQAFTVAQKRYEKGMISAIELGNAKTLFVTAQNENLQARSRLAVNQKTLEFYQGLPVFDIGIEN